MAVAVCGCSGPASAPTAFGRHNSKDQSFGCDYPEGWDTGASSGTGFASLVATKGNAKVEVRSDFVGSMLGDLAESGNRMAGVDNEERPPELKVHEGGKAQLAQDYNNFKEISEEMLRTGLGRTFVVEFTASGSFGGKLHGYYATALGRERRVTVLATCPDGDWKTLKPAFDRIVRSIAAGR